MLHRCTNLYEQRVAAEVFGKRFVDGPPVLLDILDSAAAGRLMAHECGQLTSSPLVDCPADPILQMIAFLVNLSEPPVAQSLLHLV